MHETNINRPARITDSKLGGGNISANNQNESDDKMSMRLDLNGKLKEKFAFLKEFYDLPTNTAILRHLINSKYEELTKQKT